MRSTPERAVRVRALAGDIVLCSWARQFTLTKPLSTQVYKRVPANCWGNLTNCGEVTCDGLASRPREVEILLAATCYRSWDKLRQLWTNLAPRIHYFVDIFHKCGYEMRKEMFKIAQPTRFKWKLIKCTKLTVFITFQWSEMFRRVVVLNSCFSEQLPLSNRWVC